MLRDFTYKASDYHKMYLQRAEGLAHRDAQLREAKARRIRAAIGQRLIAIGERLVETPSSELGVLDRAA